VSHDRELLDNVVTSTLVLDGKGGVGDYVGGWSDWLRQRPASSAALTVAPAPKAKPRGESRPRNTPKKLGYRDQRDLEELPGRLERLEAEQADLQQRLADPSLYRDGGSAQVTTVQARLVALDAELATGYARWEELEARQEALRREAAGDG
jgi:ATP-binding cassette subfamily F protein uup